MIFWSATALLFLWLAAGIRDALFCFYGLPPASAFSASWRGRWPCAGRHLLLFATAFVFMFLPLRWHPHMRLAAQALPLCGAAPTFLCRRKEK
ncbi:hypothetical protein [Paraburkholderia diazotrophica]|uniref:hypothetical protein n=1 Tax=Paraburkholderia diazotrophica TaxID=667676 RepID=UPI003178B95B